MKSLTPQLSGAADEARRSTAKHNPRPLEWRVRRAGSVRMPTRQRSQKPETTHTPETLWKAGTCGHAKPACATPPRQRRTGTKHRTANLKPNLIVSRGANGFFTCPAAKHQFCRQSRNNPTAFPRISLTPKLRGAGAQTRGNRPKRNPASP